jgi:hypothetical protein
MLCDSSDTHNGNPVDKVGIVVEIVDEVRRDAHDDEGADEVQHMGRSE